MFVYENGTLEIVRNAKKLRGLLVVRIRTTAQFALCLQRPETGDGPEAWSPFKSGSDWLGHLPERHERCCCSKYWRLLCGDALKVHL